MSMIADYETGYFEIDYVSDIFDQMLHMTALAVELIFEMSFADVQHNMPSDKVLDMDNCVLCVQNFHNSNTVAVTLCLDVEIHLDLSKAFDTFSRIAVYIDLAKAFDTVPCIAVYIDLTKAFDTVPRIAVLVIDSTDVSAELSAERQVSLNQIRSLNRRPWLKGEASVDTPLMVFVDART